MISRKDRKATQRRGWGVLCGASRALREQNFSRRPQGNAKGGPGVSLRRFARSARAEFLAKTATQRKGVSGGFFASLCALGEPIFSLAKGAMRRKEKHPVLREIALPPRQFPPASDRRAQRRAGQSRLRGRGTWRRRFLDISPLPFGIPHCPAMLFEYCLRDADRCLNIIHLLCFSLLNEGGLRLIFFV